MPAKTKIPKAIKINANGKAVPPDVPISISANGGATFKAAQPCTLVFNPSCPFQNASGNRLQLTQGNNDAQLKDEVTQQKYTYSVVLTLKLRDEKKPLADPFDVVIGS
jgi:hypothetical protein